MKLTNVFSRTEAQNHHHHQVDAIVDVWCEAPPDSRWEETANSAVDGQQRKDLWGGVEYWFVMGTFVSDQRSYGALLLLT